MDIQTLWKKYLKTIKHYDQLNNDHHITFALRAMALDDFEKDVEAVVGNTNLKFDWQSDTHCIINNTIVLKAK